MPTERFREKRRCRETSIGVFEAHAVLVNGIVSVSTSLSSGELSIRSDGGSRQHACVA